MEEPIKQLNSEPVRLINANTGRVIGYVYEVTQTMGVYLQDFSRPSLGIKKVGLLFAQNVN